MLFDPEDIERLSPAARIEVQDYYVRKHFADRRRTVPERRMAKLAELSFDGDGQPVGAEAVAARRPWPRVWYRNDSSRAAGQ